jgi:hypothetical protein
MFPDATFVTRSRLVQWASLNGAKCIAKPNAAEQSFGQNMAAGSGYRRFTENRFAVFGHLAAFASFGPSLFTRVVAGPAILQ